MQFVTNFDTIIIVREHRYEKEYFYFNSKRKQSIERIIDRYEVSLERYEYIKRVYPNLIDNTAGILRIIIKAYLDSDEFIDYFEKNNIRKMYNKIFSLMIIFSRVGFREKIKMILFRINPRINKSIVDIYLKLLGKK